MEDLEIVLTGSSHADAAGELRLDERLAKARRELERVTAPPHLESLTGTIGADPFEKQVF